MALYEDSLTVKEGIDRYFQLFKLTDREYLKQTFRIKLWFGLVLTLPNTKARISAVKLHDIHHVLNEYRTKLKGEAEIGAWEIASGCGKYYAAWLLNFSAILYGIFLYPVPVFKAFVKGRRCRNLYHGTEYNDELLNTNIGELRNSLGINSNSEKIKFSDLISYSFWVMLSVIKIFSPIAVIYFFIGSVF